MAIMTTRSERTGSQAPHSLSTKIFNDSTTGQYQQLLMQLQAMGFGPGGVRRTVGLTSPNRREGVTTVACNLALCAASCHDLRVLLVDANFSNPSLHRIFELKKSPGLVELAHEHLIEDCIYDFASQPFKSWPASLKNSFLRRRGFSRSTSSNADTLFNLPLSVLPVGDRNTARQNFSDPENEDFLANVFSEFDLVIVDLPAVGVSARGGFLPSQLDGVLFVLASESTSDTAALEGLQQLRTKGANVLGVALNKCKQHLPTWIDEKLGD